MFDLTGQKALVTGATGGIGGAIARSLAAQGAHVVISGTNEGKLASLADELKEQATILPCQLNDLTQVVELFDKAEAAAGDISIVVNNAGITRDMLAIRMKDEDWDEVIKVNLTAAFMICRAAIKSMMKRRYGRIINISSVVGSAGNPGQANYCAAKAGLIGMSKSLALEIATRGITVNSISPGFIETAMTDKLNDAQKEVVLKQVPMNKIGASEDIAAAVVYLASQEANYVTGQTLHINGGMYLA
ncbi:MAG: 3-oxoacyl-[acyl-carrier-protein] reductase [Alphaproteobacteria bacterium]|mgnify:CR=1 FL=1|nr:3-oxoacyl-[acyl-carrier-protein] reductase [Alphaproteobacteria bacterium]OJV46479.1 MAG: 3-oxoacyl-[acyl-carrier-protein] reductase [Alphaproteobacteria bacterium 43-37]